MQGENEALKSRFNLEHELPLTALANGAVKHMRQRRTGAACIAESQRFPVDVKQFPAICFARHVPLTDLISFARPVSCSAH